MNRLVLLLSCVAVVACGGDDKEPLFQPQPECEGAPIAPLAGENTMVISHLEIGMDTDGFDFDGDGEPDNKLAGVGSLANTAIQDSFDKFDILIPLEFFDFQTAAADECVKFAMYLGIYKQDNDGDGEATAENGGDCNDLEMAISPNATEVPDNFRDDDCDGLADETETVIMSDAGNTVEQTPSTNTDDMDGDGVTIADGDCDDTLETVNPNLNEVCNDGLDNNCDGAADWQEVSGVPVCSPYDDTPDEIALDPLAFNADGSPIIAFNNGSSRQDAAVLRLDAGPSIFAIQIPIDDDISLDLKISGATIEGEFAMTPAGLSIVGGRLGGVIDANTADRLVGLDVPEIGLSVEDSLLDATYANILGTLLGLPRVIISDRNCPNPNQDEGGCEFECQTPDIDVDVDGLEAFCDDDFLDMVKKVVVCVDGNGAIFYDQQDAQGNTIRNCTEEVDSAGNLRFVDGISVELNFETVPATLPATLPPLQ